MRPEDKQVLQGLRGETTIKQAIAAVGESIPEWKEQAALATSFLAQEIFQMTALQIWDVKEGARKGRHE